MSNWQCSACLEKYTFDEFFNLTHDWVDKKNKKKYGKVAICKCGKRFHTEKWQLKTTCDNYIVSTVHLEMEHPPVEITMEMGGYWYETMIYKENKDGMDFLPFQYRYRTRDEAEKGHKFVVENINKIILHPNNFPTDIFTKLGKLLNVPIKKNHIKSTEEEK